MQVAVLSIARKAGDNCRIFGSRQSNETSACRQQFYVSKIERVRPSRRRQLPIPAVIATVATVACATAALAASAVVASAVVATVATAALVASAVHASFAK